MALCVRVLHHSFYNNDWLAVHYPAYFIATYQRKKEFDTKYFFKYNFIDLNEFIASSYCIHSNVNSTL